MQSASLRNRAPIDQAKLKKQYFERVIGGNIGGIFFGVMGTVTCSKIGLLSGVVCKGFFCYMVANVAVPAVIFSTMVLGTAVGITLVGEMQNK